MAAQSNQFVQTIRLPSTSEICAIIVRNEFDAQGVEFFTTDEMSQQLGFISHPTGKEIQPHIHQVAERTVSYTQEVLFLKKGKLRIDFYDEDRAYFSSETLRAGDTVLLIKGGHGFLVEESVVMLEVKQGPYSSKQDKIRFDRPKELYEQ